MMRITIFTATYNRGHLLERVWRSLVEQGFDGMEWVVVDDGSTDVTREVVEGLKERSAFDVVYMWKENGGKHTAINEGVRLARGDLFVMVDSDDWLAEGALKKVWNEWSAIEDKTRYAGICGVDLNADGAVVGGGLGKERIDSDSIEIRTKYKVEGDLKEVFRTDVLREFPFPEIDGEKFCPEQLVWYRIAHKYKLRFFNEGIYVVEYQKGGLTERIVKVRMESPVGSMMTYSEAVRCDIGFVGKVRSAINYWRFWRCGKGVGIDLGWGWCAPIGWMMRVMDSMRK